MNKTNWARMCLALLLLIFSFNVSAQKTFKNPILPGFHPDPSICRVENDYYMVTSSFEWFPGLPIFHSKDLVNWEQIGHVLDRPSQLQMKDGLKASNGLWAPTIRYHQGTYYVICTATGCGGNFFVTADSPEGPYSEPIFIKDAPGIDPSLFFDDNGKAYVVHNDAPAKANERYSGHRVIKIWDYDVENDKVVPGTDRIIVNGGVNIEEKPIWIEAPHIYKKDGRYYLMCAEGGTGGWHSEVIFVSDHPKGPYLPANNNPILTQRYFPANRADKVDWAGHADLVEGPDGKYYGVFLGIRPNEKNRVNTGRETFILPVDWSGIFPVFENGLIPMKPTLKMPSGVENQTGKNGYLPSGNFVFKDDFSDKTLDFRWIGLRGPREDFVDMTDKGLRIIPFTSNINEVKPTSTLFYRQQHNQFTAAATMEYKPKNEKDFAGITCYQNERYHYVFGITKKGKDYYLMLQRTEKGQASVLGEMKIETEKPVTLQVTANGDGYRFNYSIDGKSFLNLGGTVSGDILSTNEAGGFTGAMIGLYATSVGY